MKYYEINEEIARHAHNINSMRDYKVGNATAKYRDQVDSAAELVEQQKKAVSKVYHDKLDKLLDKYARRLAKYYNMYYRNEATGPSILIPGYSKLSDRKKSEQESCRETLLHEWRNIQTILDKIIDIKTNDINFDDPKAREMLVERLESAKSQHESQKRVNDYYRKNHTLDECPDITQKDREWLTHPINLGKKVRTPLDIYGIPFPPHVLQSSYKKLKKYMNLLDKYDKQEDQHNKNI